MIKYSYFFILLAIITACNGQKKVAKGLNSESQEKMILVDQNNYSGAAVTETLIITEAKSLKLFYAKVNRTRKPGLPVPEIDFAKEIVVIHCSADENFDDAKKLSIIKETDTELILGLQQMTKREQGKSSLNIDIRVSPFFVYKMPLTKKKVSLEKL